MEKIMRNIYALSLSVGLGMASCLVGAKDVLAFTLTDTVSSTQNLYYDASSSSPGIGTVSLAFGNGVAFTPNQDISITATGCVFFSTTLCSDSDGSNTLSFKDLNKYSLVGIWSSDANTIKPIQGGANSAFFIGSNLKLTTPNQTNSSYLFLAFNDDWFIDNSSTYTVTITGKDTVPNDSSPEVPEPTSMFGIFSILSLGAFLRERKKSRAI